MRPGELPLPVPHLKRPDLGSDLEPPVSRLPGADAVPAPMPAWAPPPPSVPKVRRAAAETLPPGLPPLTGNVAPAMREFPMDDAEERARISALAAEEQARQAAIAARPHEVVKPQEFELPALPVPWWARLPEIVSSNRQVQIGILAVGLAVLAVALWPRSNRGVAISRLKSNPERYADMQVRVQGRVSEVFAVGGSWAYTLVQGRDTLVVFSRTRNPRPQENLTVVGTLSTGHLDGQPRVSLFEAMVH